MSKTEQFMTIIKTPTYRLALTYLAIIMLMSISFSVIFYNATTRPFDRPNTPASSQVNLPFTDPRVFDIQVRQAITERLEQTRQELFIRLIWINGCILLVGAGVSYFLARKSLEPIEQTMEAQAQFISDASHELRTPLTVLQTTNEVALRKKKLSAAETTEILEHNVTETKKLRDLSNTLLELLSDETSDVTLEPIDIQEVVRDAMQSIIPLAQSKDISVDDRVENTTALTNKSLLEQLLGVLLDNAVKYSPSGGKITLTSTVQGKTLSLHVQDTGYGIRASDLPHIFQRFYRADKSRTSDESSGYGLGLAIAEKISKKIHAQIEATSTRGKGSIFTVRLPLDD